MILVLALALLSTVSFADGKKDMCCAKLQQTTCAVYSEEEGGARTKAFCNTEQANCERTEKFANGCGGTWIAGVPAPTPVDCTVKGANSYCSACDQPEHKNNNTPCKASSGVEGVCTGEMCKVASLLPPVDCTGSKGPDTFCGACSSHRGEKCKVNSSFASICKDGNCEGVCTGEMCSVETKAGEITCEWTVGAQCGSMSSMRSAPNAEALVTETISTTFPVSKTDVDVQKLQQVGSEWCGKQTEGACCVIVPRWGGDNTVGMFLMKSSQYTVELLSTGGASRAREKCSATAKPNASSVVPFTIISVWLFAILF